MSLGRIAQFGNDVGTGERRSHGSIGAATLRGGGIQAQPGKFAFDGTGGILGRMEAVSDRRVQRVLNAEPIHTERTVRPNRIPPLPLNARSDGRLQSNLSQRKCVSSAGPCVFHARWVRGGGACGQHVGEGDFSRCVTRLQRAGAAEAPRVPSQSPCSAAGI